MKKILVIEDDTILNLGVCFNLELEEYRAIPAYSVEIAMKILGIEPIDLIILDVNLPDGNGFELCKEIRRTKDIPIVFLTACDVEHQIMEGFDIGADDYITKPFNINVLCKKVSAILKRCEREQKQNIFTYGDITFNFEKMVIEKDNTSILITPTEYKILKIFISNPERVLTRKNFLELLWDQEGNFVDEHTLTVSMNRLRSKIESNDQKFIKTVYGMGYMWIGEK